jgi:hypothetical protein
MFKSDNGWSNLTRGDEETDCQLARGLGWTSIAIGLTEIAAPKFVQNLLGLDDNQDRRGTLRVLGLREVAHGLSILTEPEPTPQLRNAVWSRVAGDALDTALLGVAATKTKRPGRFALVAGMVMCIGVLDFLCAKRLTDHVD